MTTPAHSGAELSLRTGDEILSGLRNPHGTESTIAENTRIENFVFAHAGLAGGFFYGVDVGEAGHGHRPDVGFMPSEGPFNDLRQALVRDVIEHAAPDIE